MTEPEKKRHPEIGFLGLVLLVIGIVAACGAEGALWPFAVIAVGGLILAIALFTGNLKFMG